MNALRRMSATRAAGLTGCVVAALALGACGSSQPATANGALTSAPPVSASPTVTAASSTDASPSPTAVTATVTATLKTSPTPKKSTTTVTGLAAARAQWKLGATASSAAEGANWDKAAADLTAGKSTDPGDTSYYAAAVKELKQLIALPDAQQTATQNAEFKSDVMELDTFFGTPGLYQ